MPQTDRELPTDEVREQERRLARLLRGSQTRSAFAVWFIMAQIAFFMAIPVHIWYSCKPWNELAQQVPVVAAATFGVSWSSAVCLAAVGAWCRFDRRRLAGVSVWQLAGTGVAVALLTVVVPANSMVPAAILMVGLGAIELQVVDSSKRLAMVLAGVLLAVVVSTAASVAVYRTLALDTWRSGHLAEDLLVRMLAVGALLLVTYRLGRRQYRVAHELNELLNKLPCGVDIISDDFQFLYANRWQLRQFGLSISDDGSCYGLVHGSDEPCRICTVGDAIREGRMQRVEHIRGHGSVKVTACRAAATYDGKRVAVEIVDPLMDVEDLVGGSISHDRSVLKHDLRASLSGSYDPGVFRLGRWLLAAAENGVDGADRAYEMLVHTDAAVQKARARIDVWAAAPLQAIPRMRARAADIIEWYYQAMNEAGRSRSGMGSTPDVRLPRIAPRAPLGTAEAIADRSALMQAFRILVTNFLTYADGSAVLRSEVFADDRYIVLEFYQDNDPIPDADVAILFSDGTRGSRAEREPDGQGTSLGRSREALRRSGTEFTYDSAAGCFRLILLRA